MLHFILVLLKIVGFIILGILGLLLTLVLLILFVPVRYKSRGSYHDKLLVEASVYWLFHLLYGRISYDGEDTRVQVRVLGYPVVGGPARSPGQKRRKKGRSNKRSEEISSRKSRNQNLPGEKDGRKQAELQKSEAVRKPDTAFQEPRHSAKAVSEGTKKSTVFQKIGSFISDLIIKMKEGFQNLKFTIKKIYGKLKEIRKDFRSAIKYLQSEEWKRLFQFIKKEIIGIIKHIRPRKYSLTLRFGFADPANTGILLGCLALLPVTYQKTVVLIPDFNEAVLKGDYDIRGRVRCFTLLIAGLKIYFNKEVKSLRRKWQAYGERS